MQIRKSQLEETLWHMHQQPGTEKRSNREWWGGGSERFLKIKMTHSAQLPLNTHMHTSILDCICVKVVVKQESARFMIHPISLSRRLSLRSMQME